MAMLVSNSLTDYLTNSLTDSCLVNLINVSLACEDGNSKLVEVYSATYSIQFLKVVKIWKLKFGHEAKFCSDFEHKVWSRV